MSRTVQFAQLLLMAWLVHQLPRTDRDRDLLTQAFVLGCLVMIIVALAAYVTGARGGNRDATSSANELAAVAALGIPMAWGLMLRRSFPVPDPQHRVPLVRTGRHRAGGVTGRAADGSRRTCDRSCRPAAPRSRAACRAVGSLAGNAVLTFTWLPQAVMTSNRTSTASVGSRKIRLAAR